MYLMYVDESGSTGTDYNNKQQPFFILAGVCIKDENWHPVNDFFECEKNKIYPDFKDIEIHTNELFNSNQNSAFYKNYWKDNFNILEKLVELIICLDIQVLQVTVHKKSYKKHFGNHIIVDPYLYSYAILYQYFNDGMFSLNDYGIVFCDELRKIENDIEFLYPKLKNKNKNILEKTFYLNSKKNNFIQIADLCAFYINKYNCIKTGNFTMDDFKKEHCLRMYQKISTKLGTPVDNVDLNDFDNYFK